MLRARRALLTVIGRFEALPLRCPDADLGI
jgi:hypothetical protein